MEPTFRSLPGEDGGQRTDVPELLMMTAAGSPLAVYTLFFNLGHQQAG